MIKQFYNLQENDVFIFIKDIELSKTPLYKVSKKLEFQFYIFSFISQTNKIFTSHGLAWNYKVCIIDDNFDLETQKKEIVSYFGKL